MDKPSNRPRDDAPSLKSGDKIGRYEIRRAIGRGGMGEVYLAEDTLLHRPVALKRVNMDLAGDPDEQKRRMLGEAQRASSLSDGRIAGVFDFLVEDSEQLLIMEYIPGPTLREIMAEPLPLDLFWDIAVQCVEALQAAHREGLVHRDIKPENIIRTPAGSVRLIDFGIARRFGPLTGESTRAADSPFEAEPTPTEALPEDKLLGTPAYMAPEALRGEVADRRSDVFALGVLFHEMLAGSRPFRGDTTLSVVAQILNAEPEPLAEVAPHAPHALVTVIQRMLAKDAARRPSSAGELLEDLVAARREADSEPTQVMVPQPPRREFPWMRVVLGILGLAVMGGMLELNNPAHRIPVQRWLGMDLLPDKKHIAILPPVFVGDDPQTAAFSTGLAEFLGAGLMRLTGDSTLQVASPGLVRRYRVDDATTARSVMGANLALQTELKREGNLWRTRAMLTDTRHDQTLSARSMDTPAGDAVALVNGLYDVCVDMLGIEGAPDGVSTLHMGTEVSGAFASYLEGMGKLRTARDTTDVLESRVAFELALSIDPECQRARVGMGWAALSLHRFTKDPGYLEDVERECRRALAQDEDLPGAHLLLARVRDRSGDPEGARREYERVLELDPLHEDGYYELGQLLARGGNRDEAEATFLRAAAARPHCWPSYWWLGGLYLQQGRMEAAAEMFAKLVETDPENYRGHVNLGGLLVLSGRYEEGAGALERALALKPSDSALSNLATAYFNQRRFDLAIKGYQDALGDGRSGYEIWGNLGDAFYWAPGKRALAEAPYRKAVAVGRQWLEDPSLRPHLNAAALSYLANIFPKLDQPDSALVYLDRAVTLAPDDYDVQYYAALVHWQLDRRGTAFEWLAKAVDGGYPRVWIRDSPVFDDWRRDERFAELVAEDAAAVPIENTQEQGG